MPTLAAKPRFIENHCVANKHKPSGIDSKENAFRNYLLPMYGSKKLDAFVQEDVARVKVKIVDKAANTVNNVLTTWNQALKCAVDWGVITAMRIKITLLKVKKGVPKFYDFDQYAWLVDAAGKIEHRIELAVLLGRDAGLRRGEIIALEFTDCDTCCGLVSVERSEWKGHVTETKGMECRVVPMTKRLRACVQKNRHLSGERLLYTDSGEQVTAKVLQKWRAHTQRRAQLRATGGLHLLRHSFCSHLAMRGAPALSIQKLAGHQNLQTTLRYMHLSPGETDRAIRLLEGTETATEHAKSDRKSGDNRETATNVVPFPNHHE